MRKSQFFKTKNVRTAGLSPNVLPTINPLNAELNPICHLLTLLGAHHILHVSRIRVKASHKNEQLSDVLYTWGTSLKYPRKLPTLRDRLFLSDRLLSVN
jgi:hypothetical protein